MGYSHYWRQVAALPEANWAAFVLDCRAIVRTAEATGTMLDFATSHGDWVLWLNGRGSETCETFVFECAPLSARPRGGDHSTRLPCFSFVKTRRLPYDTAVVACLLAAVDRFGGLVEVSSDGGPADWMPGRELYERALGREAPKVKF